MPRARRARRHRLPLLLQYVHSHFFALAEYNTPRHPLYSSPLTRRDGHPHARLRPPRPEARLRQDRGRRRRLRIGHHGHRRQVQLRLLPDPRPVGSVPHELDWAVVSVAYGAILCKEMAQQWAWDSYWTRRRSLWPARRYSLLWTRLGRLGPSAVAVAARGDMG